VGAPEEWDLVAARQVTLLLVAGLRDTHRLVDIGCGSLRAGRMLLPYLRPGRYFGVEPNSWLVERERTRAWARLAQDETTGFPFRGRFLPERVRRELRFRSGPQHFSHAYSDLDLTPEGKLFATFKEGPTDHVGSGWLYREMVPYTWEKLNGIIEVSGLVARRLDWMQPRQSWFVAAHPNAEGEIEDLSHRFRRPLWPQ
jgi:hypothetical protein